MDFDFFSTAILKSDITHQFSLLLVSITKGFFELFKIPVQTNSRNLALYNSVGVLVDSTCLGYRGIILFSFFILAYKGNIISKLVYISLGIIVLEGGNLLRIILLAYIQYCCPAKFDIFHFYLAKIIFYPLILILWIMWAERFSTYKNIFNKN